MEVQMNEKPRVFCDTGRHAGQYRVDFTGSCYMTLQEWEVYARGYLRVSLVDRALPDMREIDFIPFSSAEPVVWNALVRHGWGSVAGLAAPVLDGHGIRPDLEGWEALWELPNIGPRRILALVNFLRDNGVELPWMADWDERSAHWTALEGCRRAETPGD